MHNNPATSNAYSLFPLVLSLFYSLFPIPYSLLLAQTAAPVSNPQAVAVLTQSLTVSGTATNRVNSFTATGTITYFWAGQQVQGNATIRAQGLNQFRLDATLSAGARSLAFSDNSAALKDQTGKLTPIPLHNTFSMAESSFPYLQIAALLADPTFTVSDLGLVASGSQQLRQVRAVKNIPAAQDPEGIVATLSQTDYFVDPTTNLVAKTVDQTHPIETFSRSYPREVDLQSYKTINGVSVPTLVIEKIGGQTIWQFTLSGITFNTPLTSADFTLQ